MTLENDGTCWDYTLPLVRELQARAIYGKVYTDPSLEAKRREAIAWLRTESAKGYCVDQIKSPIPASLRRV